MKAFFRYFLAGFVIVATVVVSTRVWQKYNRSKMPDAIPHDIEIYFGKHFSLIKGLSWHTRSNGTPLLGNGVQNPSILVIHLPSGRVIISEAMMVTMRIKHESDPIISHVSLLPLSKVVEFSQAAKEIHQLVDKFKIDPNKQFNLELNNLESKNIKPTQDEYFNRYALDTVLESGVTMSFVIKPHPTAGGWYLVVDLYFSLAP